VGGPGTNQNPALGFAWCKPFFDTLNHLVTEHLHNRWTVDRTDTTTFSVEKSVECKQLIYIVGEKSENSVFFALCLHLVFVNYSA